MESLQTNFRPARFGELNNDLPLSSFDKFMGATKLSGHQIVIEQPQLQGYDTRKAKDGKEYLTKDGQFVYYMQSHFNADLAKHYTRLFNSGQLPEGTDAMAHLHFNYYAPALLNIVNWANKYNAVAGFQWVKKIKDHKVENYDYDIGGRKYRVMYDWFKMGKVAAVKQNDKIITQIRMSPQLSKNLLHERTIALFDLLAKTVILNGQNIRNLDQTENTDENVVTKKKKFHLPEMAVIAGASILLGGGVVNAQYANHQQKINAQKVYTVAGNQAVTIAANSLTYEEFVAAISQEDKAGAHLSTKVIATSWQVYQNFVGQTLTFEQFVTEFHQFPQTPSTISLDHLWSQIKAKNEYQTMFAPELER